MRHKNSTVCVFGGRVLHVGFIKLFHTLVVGNPHSIFALFGIKLCFYFVIFLHKSFKSLRLTSRITFLK